MKKFLLIALSVLLGMPLMAQVVADGSTQARAIKFNWKDGNTQNGGTSPLWYRVDLTPLYDDVESPTLALYLTNLSNSDATVTIKATLFGNTEERSYTIAPKGKKIWSMGASALVQTNTKEVYLTLASDQIVALSASVYETEDMDDACVSSTLFVVGGGASTTQAAGTSVWYNIDLTDALPGGNMASNDVDVIITNNGSATATVQGALSMDCPSSGVSEYTMSIPAGGSTTRTLKRAMIDALTSNNVYLRVNTNQPLTITTDLGAFVPPTGAPVFSTEGAIEAELETLYNVSSEQVYKIHLDSLRGKRVMPEVTVTNPCTTAATVTAQIGLTPNPKSVIEKTVTIAAGESLVKDIEKNMVDGISAQDGYVYVRIVTTQAINFSARLKHVNEGNACKNSREFDWENGHTQEANTTVWYAVNIAEAKTNVQDIILTVENLASAKATLKAEVAFACPYIDLQTATRTLAAGASQTQTLSYSSYGMLTTDIVYVGLTTNQKVKISAQKQNVVLTTPDDACLSAVVFDMTEGGKQNAGDTVWYKVGMNSLRMLDQLPYVSIQNRGTAPVTIHAALSLDCPYSIPNSERSLTIGVGGTYEKLISRDLLDNIAPAYDTVYVRLTANQAFAFQVQLKEENPGATCKSAVRFNWTSGNDQDADTRLWYMVDLTVAKAGKKDVKLSIINKDNAAATVTASFAFDCPCEVPQTESTKLGALAYKTTTLPYSALETAGDTVWVRLSTDRTIHFEAALVDPAPFDTIDCADITLNDLVLNKWYQDVTDTTWFILTGSVLERLKNAGDSTIELNLHNKVNTANTITAHVAYHCPITSTMVSRQVTLSGDQYVEKLLERNFIEQIADKDTILVRLVATNKFSFLAEIVDPNDGDDCLHAIPFNIPDPIGKQLGPHETRWYKLDVDSVSKINKMITFGIWNVDGGGGRVNVALYTSCDSAALIERTITLGRNKGITKEFSSDIFKGLNTRYLYLKVDAEYGTRLNATVASLTPLNPPIEACLDAYPVAPNTDYTLSAGDTAWYVVNMQDLRANTKGDGTLTVKNLSATDTLTATAEISWVCPVQYQMSNITRSIAAGGQYVQTLSRSSIDATSDSLLYVRVSGNQDLSFRLDISYSKGETCENAIEFDWVNGNVHAGSTKPLWYHLSLTEDKVPEGKDLRLYIDNLDALNATDAGASLYFECGASLITSIEHSFGAGASKHSDIDRTMLKNAGWPDLYICYWSSKNTKIYVELVEHVSRLDTTRFSICSGTEWINPVTKETMKFYGPTDPFAEFSDPLQWNDTVAVREGSFICDSIYTFIVKPYYLPFNIAETALQQSNTLPIVKEGMQLFTDSSWVNIQRFLAQNDSIVLNTGVSGWKLITDTGDVALPIDTILPKDAGTISLKLFLQDSCENTNSITISIAPQPYRVDSIEVDTTICYGTDFTTRLSNTYTLTQDTIIRDTVACTATDTLNLTLHYDSVYIYQLTVHPLLTTTIEDTICEGEHYTFGRLSLEATGTYTDTLTSLATGCDSIVTLNLTVQAPVDTIVEADTICVGDTYTWRDMVLSEAGTYLDTAFYTTGCDSVYYELHLTVQEPTHATVESQTICAGDTYTWRDMVLSEAGTYLDTAFYTTGCDSVYYELHLTVQAPTYATVETQTICAGDTYTWRDMVLSETGTYLDTAFYTTGCDSVYYELHLTVQEPTHATVESQTICAGDTYTWRDMVLSETGTYLDTAFYTTGCDSVYYELHLTVQAPTYATVESQTICAGDTYTWRDMVLSEAGTYLDTAFYTTGCDSVYYELHLTVQAPTDATVETQTIPAGTTFTWRDLVLSETGTYLDTAFYTTGCDSVYYELQLTVADPIARDTTIIDTVCVGTEWQSRTQSVVITQDTIWDEQVRFKDAVNGDIDSTYHYNIHVFLTTTPAIDTDSIVAICGRAVDVTAADNFLTAAIENEPLYAPNAQVAWEQLENDLWLPISPDALAGNISEITVRYSITTDCGIALGEPIVVSVQMPDPSNTEAMANLPAVSKFNHYLLMINLNAIQNDLGWTLSEEDVTWYQVAGEADATHPEDTEKDIEVGKGFYYTTGEMLNGEYYALIAHHQTSASDCAETAATTILVCTASAAAPALQPTMASPEQDIYVLNLNPLMQTEIRVYDVEGNLLNTYTSTEAEQFIIRAAGQQGYYIVDVQTDEQKTTLRYIVK